MADAPLTDGKNGTLYESYWFLLYRDFISQTGTIKLRAKLETLEAAIFERTKELADSKNSHAEKLAIRVACEKILEVKVKKLGFPAVHSENGFPRPALKLEIR